MSGVALRKMNDSHGHRSTGVNGVADFETGSTICNLLRDAHKTVFC